MPVYHIYMNQGVAGDLRIHTFWSDQFKSCAPIVLYNPGSHLGALYHFAGGTITSKQTAHIRTLITTVRPTVAYVLCGGGMYTPGKDMPNITREHVDGVTALFRGTAKVRKDVDGKETFPSIKVTEKDGALRLKARWPDTPRITYLDTQAAIQSLPKDVSFVGEMRDSKLEQWS